MKTKGTAKRKPLIGIVGGMGPAAGIDLADKIILNTAAATDQEHLAQVLVTEPAVVGDRTAFLLGKSKTNPAFSIARILLKLEAYGATVAGIPCNTAHAPPIFKRIEQKLEENHSGLTLLNMIEEVAAAIKLEFPKVKKTGILGTNGIFVSRAYDLIEKRGLQTLYPSEEEQQRLHRAIYDRNWGIKALNRPGEKAMATVRHLVNELAGAGADAVILACTELSMISGEQLGSPVPVIDSTLALARGLIKAVAPEKLKP